MIKILILLVDEKKIEAHIKDYINDINTSHVTKEISVLSFWKAKESRWTCLSKIAKKVLGVPASSSGVEHMFSISGHIYSQKRRRMKALLFQNLVFLKLNETLLKFF